MKKARILAATVTLVTAMGMAMPAQAADYDALDDVCLKG